MFWEGPFVHKNSFLLLFAILVIIRNTFVIYVSAMIQRSVRDAFIASFLSACWSILVTVITDGQFRNCFVCLSITTRYGSLMILRIKNAFDSPTLMYKSYYQFDASDHITQYSH